MAFNDKEANILQALEGILRKESVIAIIDPIVASLEEKLVQDPKEEMAWKALDLEIFGASFPKAIQSGWVFVFRAGTATGSERHPNSHQRILSYRGKGDIQIWEDGKWNSYVLTTDFQGSLETRWASVPPDVWHQAMMFDQNWVVLSFHTVPRNELIEERPDPMDPHAMAHQKYLED